MRTLLTASIVLLVLCGTSGRAVSSGNLGPSAAFPELVLQSGHSKAVRTVILSPDDSWAASGSFDSTIRIWSLGSGRELRSLTGHLGAVGALACSPDGAMLASGGIDGTVRLWNVPSGTEVRSFKHDGETIEAVAFSQDGRLLASGGSGGTVIVREVATGRETAQLAGHTGPVSSLAFSPDGRSLASGSADNTIRIWNAADGKLLRTLKGHTERISVLRFDNAGGVLASGSDDMTVMLWNPTNGRRLAVLGRHVGEPLALSFVSAEKLVSADSEGEVKIWSMAGKRGLLSTDTLAAKSSGGERESAVFSHDGAFLAVGNGDGTVTVADAKNGETLNTLENHTVGYYAAGFSPDRHWLAAAGFDNTVKLWDLQTGRSLSPLKGHTGRVTSLAFHPDNRRVISASIDHTIKIWDTLSREPLETLKGHANSISSIAVGGKGKMLVSASADQTIGIWDLETKSPPRFLKGHAGEVISVSISADERFIASAGMDATIRTWDARSGAPVRTIEPNSGEIDAVAFSQDGKLLASGGIDKTIRIWESDTGRLLRALPGHTGKVNSVAFSPDGKQIVSSSQDKTIRVWSVSDGRQVRETAGHSGPVFSVSFSADSTFLASASDDGSVVIWKAENGDRLGTLVSLKGSDDWLAVTPDGFFDGSPSSWQQLSWRFGGDTFDLKPVEVFFSEFYSPGLVADLLNGSKPPSRSSISDKDRRQPQVKLTLAGAGSDKPVTTRLIKAVIDVSQAPAGARDVRLFRNGSLVKVWRGDVLKGQDRVALEEMVPIVAGENRLTAYAFNRDDIKSSDASIVINGSPDLARKSVLYVMAVGVNEYANPEYDLKYAVADARDFAEEVKRRQTDLKTYERVEVMSLNDKAATKSAVLNSLTGLAARLHPEDGLIIYFAGHGTAQQNHFYLIPHDLGYGGRRTELDSTGLQSIMANSISDEELQQAVEAMDAGLILLVIDACNSGQALEAEEKRRGPMNSKGLAQLAYEKGMYILTAAQSYQAAQEAVRLGHGFLTFALVEEGLKTNRADLEPKDGQVTLREWLDYATARVPQIQQDELTARQLEREKAVGKVTLDAQSVQRPRVFYRHETERYPLIVARP